MGLIGEPKGIFKAREQGVLRVLWESWLGFMWVVYTGMRVWVYVLGLFCYFMTLILFIVNYIRRFDAFGIDNSFTKNGKEKFRTLWGNIIIILVWALILAFLIVMILEPVWYYILFHWFNLTNFYLVRRKNS